MGQVMTRAELAQTSADLKKSGKRLVTTNGCFDLLHIGHVRILQAAKQLGDVLIVGINSDASVRKLKGASRPVTPGDQRAEILASLACVDYVTIFDEDTPVEFLKAVKPNIHVKGSDYKPSDLAETPVVESFGGTVKILDLVPGHSTTSILKKINAG
jgi:rfaE bifunctional protein nucleotidyltransferase chain/domain